MPSPSVGAWLVSLPRQIADRAESKFGRLTGVHGHSYRQAKKRGLRGSSGVTDDILGVLAQRGRPAADWRTPAIEGDGQRHEIVAELGHTLKHTQGFHLRLSKHLAQVLDGRAGDASLLERVDPLSLCTRGKHA